VTGYQTGVMMMDGLDLKGENMKDTNTIPHNKKVPLPNGDVDKMNNKKVPLPNGDVDKMK
jgi:hypothetical protein